MDQFLARIPAAQSDVVFCVKAINRDGFRFRAISDQIIDAVVVDVLFCIIVL